MQRVRPTKNSLSDIGMEFPPLTDSLSRLDHPVVSKAQEIPASHDAGAVERIRSVTDRPIFKIKIDDWRAAAASVKIQAEISDRVDVPAGSEHWWIVAAGHRKSDTPKQDFYGRLTDECKRAAKGMRAKVNSDSLLPQLIDYERLVAESAAIAVENIKYIVRQIICRAAQTSGHWSHEIAKHKITALVKTAEGETYLAITAEGFVDPETIAIILGAVPGVMPSDWGVEPGEVLGVRPQHDQVVFSAILPPEILAAMLEEHDQNHL